MSRVLYVAWRSGDNASGRWGPVGRLEHEHDTYRFAYTRGARNLPGFTPFPGMPDLEEVYESDKLFPVFSNRLPTRSRPEYEAFLTWGGFDPDHPPDPIAILAVTQGRRATDELELFPRPQRDQRGFYNSKFFLHGIRWAPPEAVKTISMLQANDKLDLRPEPDNLYDPRAVEVYTAFDQNGLKIGYVPRYLAGDIGTLIELCPGDSITLEVERVNAGAPLQQRLLCKLQAPWPASFEPCEDDDFQPINSNMHSVLP